MWCVYLAPEVLNGWECTDGIQCETRADLNIVKKFNSFAFANIWGRPR